MNRRVLAIASLLGVGLLAVGCASTTSVSTEQAGPGRKGENSPASVNTSMIDPPPSMISVPPPAPTNPTVPGVPAASKQTCEQAAVKGSFNAAKVERAEEATAAQVTKWQTNRFANTPFKDTPSPYAKRPPTERFTVCLFSGHFATPHPPELPDHDRLRLIVAADGTTTVDAAGYANNLIPELPTDVPNTGQPG